MDFSKPQIKTSDIYGALKALSSGNLAQGKNVEVFEKRFADLHKRQFGIAVNSGTSALHLALMAMGVGRGDKVLVPGISFAATANAVALTGATPVFVDINPDTFNLDLGAAKSQLGQNVRAVIPVDLFGLPISREELDNFASQSRIEVLIDSSQSHLATSGAESYIESKFHATYSFYPTKNMTTGEGGMVITNDENLAQNVRMLRNQGMSSQYRYEMVGLNNRMTDIAGAIGVSQLTRLRRNTNKRREIASVYSFGLQDIGSVHIQTTPNGAFHVYHQFTITVAEQRDKFRKALESDGVPTRVYYPQPLNKIKPFFEKHDLPNAKKFSETCLSLPIGPHISRNTAKRVIQKVRRRLEVGW